MARRGHRKAHRPEHPGFSTLFSRQGAWAQVSAGHNSSCRMRILEGPHFLKNSDPESVKFLQANSQLFVDGVTVGLVATIALITVFGRYLGKRYWVPAMVIASYLVLIPGLFTKDFSFSIALLVRDYAATLPAIKMAAALGIFSVDMLPKRLMLSEMEGHTGPIRESTRSLVKFLWDTGSHRGAVFIAIFAFVVPALKLVFLGLGALWRRHPDAWRVRTARYMVILVQMISKWASPDMFAFALLYYLFRTLNSPPLIESLQVFDIGFVCYNIFCVSSVVSTLFVELPELPKSAEEREQEAEAQQASARMLQTLGGRTSLIFVTLVHSVAWGVLFFFGLFSPVMQMRLDPQTILEDDHFPQEIATLVRTFIDLNSISEMVNADVSVWRATAAFWGWFFHSGELTLLLGLVMLGVHCIAFTVLDIALLLLATFTAGSSGLGSRILEAASFFKHLAMLDVCLAGMWVVTFAAAVYEKQGIFITLTRGVWLLLGSEILHYLTYYIVHWGVKNLEHVPEKFTQDKRDQ